MNYQIKMKWQFIVDSAPFFYSHDGNHFIYMLLVADTLILKPSMIWSWGINWKQKIFPANPREFSLQNIEKNKTVLSVIKH